MIVSWHALARPGSAFARLLLLSFTLGLPLVAGCPDETTTDAGDGDGDGDGAPADAGGDEGQADASIVDGDGGARDGGAAAPLDGGLDAGPVDAGFMCVFPDLDPPATADAGPEPCDEDLQGFDGYFAGTWEGDISGALDLTGPFAFPASGEMTFEIVCSGEKLLVDGVLEGEAENPTDGGAGFPFFGQLYGEFDPATATVQLVANPVTLNLGFYSGTFKVQMTGERVNNTFQGGNWCGVTLDPPGGQGEGTWTASLFELQP
jgi:hypothetical protein